MNNKELNEIINTGLEALYDSIEEEVNEINGSIDGGHCVIDRPAMERHEKEVKAKLIEMLGE